MPEYKDVTYLKKQIADCKRAIQVSKSDYVTGFVCALSATEEVIAETPTADVVEVVRCKKCKHNVFEQANSIIHCNRTGKTEFRECDDFCKYGERKEVANSG